MMDVRSSSADMPCWRTQSNASDSRPRAIHTRAFLRRDGVNIRNNARNMQSLGFVEQIYGTLQIALGLAKSSPSNAAAGRRLA